MKKNDYETSRPANKERPFLRFMRYADVAIVTLCLLALLIYSTDTKDDGFVYLFLFFAVVAFYITIPIHRLVDIFFCQGHYAVHKDRQNPVVVPWSRLAPVGNDCLYVQPALPELRCLHHGRIL